VRYTNFVIIISSLCLSLADYDWVLPVELLKAYPVAEYKQTNYTQTGLLIVKH